MDFKSLITKISSMDDKIAVIPAPELPKAVQLNEDAQLRVLAGTSSYVSEAKKKAEEKKEEKEVKEEMKVGDKKNIATGTVEKTKTGIVHKSNKAYGGSEEKADDTDDEPKSKKKAKKESIDPEQFKSKFLKMVEAKKDEKPKAKKEKKVDEAKKPDANKDGIPDYAQDGKGAKDLGKGKGGAPKKGVNPFAKKTEGFDPEKMKDGDMMGAGGGDVSSKDKKKKRPVKESVETKLSFKQMVQLVQESGGQQQIDPLDKALFTWAERVAKSKLGEGMKADLYAGLIYERNGGVFEMYDVLSEDQK